MRRFVILVSVAVLAAASANCGGGSERNVLSPSSLSGSDAVSANGKGGGRKPGGGGTTGGSGSLTLVLLSDDNHNGLPSWRERITFNVTTTVTTDPFVRVDCYQGGSKVYTASVGYFPQYPWAKEFTLESGAWTGGAADCTATLYTTVDGSSSTTLATLPFRAE
jgi:hypothetical protein